MQERDLTGTRGRSEALARLKEIQALFDQLKAGLRKQMRELGKGGDAPPKTLITKIGDLTATHLMLLKAEDAFREKFLEDDESSVDYDSLRAAIGRKLDLIRDARSAGEIS